MTEIVLKVYDQILGQSYERNDGNIAKHQEMERNFGLMYPHRMIQNMWLLNGQFKIEATDNNWVGSITSDNPKQYCKHPIYQEYLKSRLQLQDLNFQKKISSPTSDSKPDMVVIQTVQLW
jgi:hypothetical protein